MPTRRLAAIMFTDIEGYTQMMSEDEAKASAIRKRHREVFEELHKKHKGEIVQYFGDGTLSIFDSCVEAVRCAIAMQQAFREVPIVPLRIGIHLGDIEYSQTEVAGNGVNIASRVESLGVSCATLVSDDVRKQVENHNISMVSMGHFEMKNVKEPTEVFAVEAEGLIIPNPKSLQGKAKRINAKRQTQKLIRLASVGFVAMALGAILFWAVGANNSEGELSVKIKEERVAAIPFKNRTSDTNLEAFGALCSDLITNGLTEAGIKTCSPQTVMQYSHLMGILPNNPEGKPAFAEVVGSRYWIEGYFLQQGDSLTVKSHLTDGLNGEVVRNFLEMKGHINTKEKLADQLARRIMGYWVSKEAIDNSNFKPPLYEAFVEYQKMFTEEYGYWPGGDQIIKHGRKAFELDTTFYMAALREMFVAADSKYLRTDTLINILNPHYEKMTPFEQGLFDANKALYTKDWEKYIKVRQKNYAISPQDPSNMHYAWHLYGRENRPNKAWEIMMRRDWENLPPSMNSWRANRMIFACLYGLSAFQYEEVIELCDKYLKNSASKGLYFLLKGIASVRSGQVDLAYDLLEDIKEGEVYPIWWNEKYGVVAYCNQVANDLLIKENREEANKFLNTALTWAFEDSSRMGTIYDSLEIAHTYRLLGEYEKALPYEKSLVYRYQDLVNNWFARGNYLSGLAIDYAMLGEREKAYELAELVWENSQIPIYAVLDDKEKAMEAAMEMKKRGDGNTYGIYALQYNYLNKSLFDYPPFQEFVRVKD